MFKEIIKFVDDIKKKKEDRKVQKWLKTPNGRAFTKEQEEKRAAEKAAAEKKRAEEWERDRPMREFREREEIKTREHQRRLDASAASRRQGMQDELDFQAASHQQHIQHLKGVRSVENEMHRERTKRAAEMTQKKFEVVRQIQAMMPPKPKKKG